MNAHGTIRSFSGSLTTATAITTGQSAIAIAVYINNRGSKTFSRLQKYIGSKEWSWYPRARCKTFFKGKRGLTDPIDISLPNSFGVQRTDSESLIQFSRGMPAGEAVTWNWIEGSDVETACGRGPISHLKESHSNIKIIRSPYNQ
jgi:hypothetical protein